MRKYGATVDNRSLSVEPRRTASSSPPARTRTLICSGACAAPAELRHRHLVRVPPAPGRADRARRADLPPSRRCPGSSALLPRVRRHRARRAHDDLRARAAPPLPILPEDVHGKPIVMVGACYAGPLRRGRGRPPAQGVRRPDRRPARAQAVPGAAVDVRPWCFRHGWHRYWKSVELLPLTDDVIDTLIDHSSRITSPRSYTIVLHPGGALARVAEDATAFSQRDAAHNVVINGSGPRTTPTHAGTSPGRDFFGAMQPHARDRVYVNFLGDEDPTASARPTAPRSTTGWSSSNASTTPELLPPQPEHPAEVAQKTLDRDQRGHPVRIGPELQ